MSSGSIPPRPLVILGLGNTDRGDDGVGPALVERLDGRCDVVCIDGGSAPENVTAVVKRAQPAAIMIVDAMDLGLRPGEVHVLSPGEVTTTGLSTHTGSLSLLSDYLEHGTGAPVHLLGIQPECLKMGAGMSSSVARTLEEIARFVLSGADALCSVENAESP